MVVWYTPLLSKSHYSHRLWLNITHSTVEWRGVHETLRLGVDCGLVQGWGIKIKRRRARGVGIERLE